jgi:outer membrane receptor protein involved in Fe transport
MLGRDFLSTAILGLYVQDEWQFAPKWKLDLGARMDYEFYGGFEPSARAALSYELTKNSSVYTAVSRAFQMPPVGIRFLEIPLLGGLTQVTSDQDVRAIPLMAYEAGYRAKFFDRLNTDLNVYLHRFDDYTALNMRPGPPGLLAPNFDNAADVLLYGLEWENKLAVNDKLTLLGNYTLEFMDWRGAFLDADLISPPKHKVMLGARYSPTHDLHLSVNTYYVDAQHSPDPTNPFALKNLAPYFRVDLRAEQEFWNKRASVAVGVRNLLDPDHPEGGTRFINIGEAPRMIYAEFRLRLDK